MVAEKARQYNAYILAGTIVERSGNFLFNTAVFLNPKGKIIDTFRKIHLVQKKEHVKQVYFHLEAK